jgi:hypothetical protein
LSLSYRPNSTQLNSFDTLLPPKQQHKQSRYLLGIVKYARINAIPPMMAEATAALSPTESPAPLLPGELDEPEEASAVVGSSESWDVVAEVEALEVGSGSFTTGVTELALLAEVGDGVDE